MLLVISTLQLLHAVYVFKSFFCRNVFKSVKLSFLLVYVFLLVVVFILHKYLLVVFLANFN